MSAFLPAALLGVLLLLVDTYFLWEWRSDQISGDVLIHLIFARNFAEGRWFEYSLNQPSRANTTILWEWILACLGIITGQIRSNEGFLTVARVFVTGCAAVTGWRMFFWGKLLGVKPSVSAVVCVFLLLNPVTFYWTTVNPMESGVTILLMTSVAIWVWRTAQNEGTRFPSAEWKEGLVGGCWIFGLSLIRPELLALAGIGALAFLLGQGGRRWRLAIMLFGIPVVLTLLQIVALYLGGQPIVPTPTTARRMIALTYDTFSIPFLGIRYNPDPWKILLALSPLGAASLWAACKGEKKNRPSHFLALGVCFFLGLFFSFYYYTTWQGRYMLPGLMVLAMPAVATLTKLPWQRSFWVIAPIYGIVLCLIVLRPLALYADAPAQRAAKPNYTLPPSTAKTLLVQEVQSAYYFPQLRHISTEGLITQEAYQAYRKGHSIYEFIMDLKPDLIAFGRYYLRDPDDLQKKINDAARLGTDLDYRDIHLHYRGDLRGGGPYFEATYGAQSTH